MRTLAIAMLCMAMNAACSVPPALNSNTAATSTPIASTASTVAPASPQAQKSPSLVALSAGAYIVKRPSEWMGSESAYALLDENPQSFWATQRGTVSPQTIVIALPEKTILKTVEFDNTKIDTQFTGCSAKDISVEVSDTSENDGFQTIADVSLKDRADNQSFPATSEVPGRWVRLTVKNNHSDDPDNAIELDEFRGYGQQLTHTPLPDVSGTYNFADFTNDLHLRQEGSSLSGCYESRSGIIKGGIEGRIAKFTWYEGGDQREVGSAVMVFPADGKQAIGVWWEKDNQGLTERILTGPKKSSNVGTCAQWAGGVQEQVAKDLEEFGRARVYGINFDTDSDQIKDESRPTLDKIIGILRSKPDLKITVEGHTDSTSTPQHNQDLSERRAASVVKYLVAGGIDAARLTSKGFGATKPVAGNDTELGRAQNRRVELAKL